MEMVYELGPDVVNRLVHLHSLAKGAEAAADAAAENAKQFAERYNDAVRLLLTTLEVPTDTTYSIDVTSGTLTLHDRRKTAGG